MPWITHPGVAGIVSVTQDQFDSLWSGQGWTITAAPDNQTPVPPSHWLHYAGDWAPSTGYSLGDVVRTPGGGLVQAATSLVTDITFSETGFVRLAPDSSTGVIASATEPTNPAADQLWWNTGVDAEVLSRWDVDTAAWVVLAGGTSGGGGVADGSVTVEDATGTPFPRRNVLIRGASSFSTDDSPNDRVIVTLTPKGKEYRLAADFSCKNSTTSTDFLTVALPSPATVPLRFSYYVEAWIRSSLNASAKLRVNAPNGATPSKFRGRFFNPRELMADGTTRLSQTAGGSLDIDLLRGTMMRVPNNGGQRVGGFPAILSYSDFHTTSGSSSISSATLLAALPNDLPIFDDLPGATITGAGIPANAAIGTANKTTGVLTLVDATSGAAVTATATSSTATLTINRMGLVCVTQNGFVEMAVGATAGNFAVGAAQIGTPTGSPVATLDATTVEAWSTFVLLDAVDAASAAMLP